MFKKIWILILTGLFTIISSNILAADYYVSTNGLDTNPGSFSYPFKTIQKAADVMTTGDNCYIMEGIYRETVTVPVSGTTNSPITFRAYNNEDVLIVGTESLDSWTYEGSNIYSTPMILSLGDRNQVFINWIMMPEARWPNAGSGYPWQDSSINPSPDWSYVDTASYIGGYGQFKDTELPYRPDDYWNGCTVHIMSGEGWIVETPNVIDYDGINKRLFTDLPTYYNPEFAQYHDITTGNEYYLIGKKEEMDSPGEWFYDSTASRLYIYTLGAPTNVEVKQRSYGFNLSGRSNIKLIGLSFFACSIQTDSYSTCNTYDRLNMQYLNHSRKLSSPWGLELRTGDVLRNSELAYDSRGLIRLRGTDIRVINNHLHDSGYVPYWTALLEGYGSRNLISHNTMHDSGRAVMGAFGKSSIAEYNDMYNAMKLTSDGGIFYTYGDAGNTIFRYNLLHDSLGAQGHLGGGVSGFYLDFYSSNWIVHHNIIWNVSDNAIFLSLLQSFNMVFNNTVWDNTAALKIKYSDGTDSGTRIFNNLVNVPIEYISLNDVGTSDIRFNLLASDSYFVDADNGDFRLQSGSPAINKGMLISGITNGYVGDAPDVGAQEYGGTDWTMLCGSQATPPLPDPVYSIPDMVFCNKVIDGGLESGSLSPNWILSAGSSVSVLKNGEIARIGSNTFKFDEGTSEVYQTVTGLLPNQRYVLYGGIKITNENAVVKLGVRNYKDQSNVEITADPIDEWVMYNLSFITGSTNTTAEIYISGIIPPGDPIYVDDLSVEMDTRSSVPSMPIVHYSLDKSTGLVANDQSLNAIDGQLQQSMTNANWVPGWNGNALTFDGIDDYMYCGNNEDLFVNSGNFTVSYWAKLQYRSPGSSTLPVVSLYENSSNFMYLGFNDAGAVRCYSKTDGVDMFSISADALDWNQWNHYAWVYNGGCLNLYVNGNYVTKCSGTIFNGQPTIRIGSRTGSSYFLESTLDEVRIYDYALTRYEIAAIKNIDTSKVVHYMLDEEAGTEAWDCSLNGNNGTLNNMDSETDWVDGKRRGALDFDGINDYINCGNDGSLFVNSGDFTVSYWAKRYSNSGTSTLPVVSLHEDFSNFMYLGFNGDGAVRCFSKTDGTSVFSISEDAPEINEWNHYTWVYSSGNLKLYVNGSLVTQSNGTIFDSQPTVWIGSRIGSNYFFKGTIDDVRIDCYALDADTVMDIYEESFRD